MTKTNAELLSVIKDLHRRRIRLSTESVSYLIEQAERNQTLENSMKKAIEMQEYYLITNGDLSDENAKLREALEGVRNDKTSP